ncbi:hypothetical protein [Streptomyces sp. YPW6]|uniref:hypothetical protein n=1 Tax=Streptomyces sp. YPW6 TaxID=2840373 RepID=UPI003EB6A2E8
MGDSRVPLPYDRAVLAGAAVREKLRTTTTGVVRGRAYDVAAHQRAAMPEQLLGPEQADPEHDDQEQKPGRGELLDLTVLRALRDSRTDVEALDVTAECLRHLQGALTAAADRAHTATGRYTRRDDAEPPHPARQDDQQAHRPQEPGPHRGRERPLSGPDGACDAGVPTGDAPRPLHRVEPHLMRRMTMDTAPGRTIQRSWNAMTSNFPTGSCLLELELCPACPGRLHASCRGQFLKQPSGSGVRSGVVRG